MRIWFLIFSFTILLGSCVLGKHLVYRDDWQGNYTLIEYNCCGDTATKVRLSIIRAGNDNYNWKMFFEDEQTDTILGEAKYVGNKLKFFVKNPEVAGKYFVKVVSKDSPVFWMEYQNQVEYYTWWYNDLKNYRRSKMIAAGIDYHFKRRIK